MKSVHILRFFRSKPQDAALTRPADCIRACGRSLSDSATNMSARTAGEIVEAFRCRENERQGELMTHVARTELRNVVARDVRFTGSFQQ